MLNGASTMSNGNSYLTGEMLRNMDAPLFRWLSADPRYQK